MRFLSLTFGLIGVLGVTSEARAQDIVWEQFYSEDSYESHHVEDIGFDDRGILYSTGWGISALHQGSNEWELICDGYPSSGCYGVDGLIGALGEDTLLVNTGRSIRISVDGGMNWEWVHDEGQALYERIPFFETSTGLLLAPAEGDIPYSIDRGLTWSVAPYPGTSTSFNRCFDFAELPSGRLLVSCIGGIAYSDDQGINWLPTDLWRDEYYPYTAIDLEIAENGEAISVAYGWDAQSNVYASSDGYSWLPRGSITYGGQHRSAILLKSSSGEIYGVTVGWNDTHVYKMSQAGLQWEQLKESLPILISNFRIRSPIIGPDDRIYFVVATNTGAAVVPEQGIYRSGVEVTSLEDRGDYEDIASLALWPNPADRVVTVHAPSASNENPEILVLDVLGRVLIRSRLENGQGALDVTDLVPGTYAVVAGQEAIMLTVQR